MGDPKKQEHDAEAATFVPLGSARPSGSPQDATAVQTPPPSEAPTIVDASPPPQQPGGPDAPTIMMGPQVPSSRSTPPTGASVSGWGGITLQSGVVLGNRYEILQVLGEGGMGAVYKAKDRELNRVIALKVIRPELASNPEILQRFKQELILARQVTDRNVIRIFDLGEASGIRYITMEYVEGESLHQILRRRGKLPVDEVLDIMKQMLSGLQAAHREGVIHRDLKPGNIMRDAQGRVVVMDFGLARSLGGDGMTRTGAMLGTMEYMSPEQAHAKELDARSDLFTVGLICYELLTGTMPYQADSAIASLLKRTQERAVPISDLDASVPQPVSETISKCLERDPANRYQSAQEILDRIDELQGRRPLSVIAPPPPSRPSATALAIPRKGLGLRTAAVAAVVIVAAAGGWFLRSRPHGPAVHKNETVLLADFRNTTADKVFDGTLEPAFALALEGASFISTFDRAQARQIAAQLKPGATQLDEANARLVAVREGIDVVVSGSIAKAGDGYKMLSKVTDAITGKTIATEEAQAPDKANVLRAVASLANQVRSDLGDKTSESAKLAEAETFTSGSLEAAHEYAEAQNARYSGKPEEAIKGFQRAIALDPNFGSAYGSLGALYWNVGNGVEAVKYYRLAMEHIDRMTDREKYRTRGGYYIAVGDGEKAVEELSALVKQYPADSMGLSGLANAYYLQHDMAHAQEASRRAMEIYPKNVVYRNNEALYALFAGDWDTAEREAQAVLTISPGYSDAMITLALVATQKGNYDNAADYWAKIEAQNVSLGTDGRADLALYRSDPVQAATSTEKGIADALASKANDAAAKKSAVLAEADLMLGKKSEALQSLAYALTLSKPDVLFPAARGYVLAGDYGKASALAAELLKQVDPMPQAFGKLIEGDVLLGRGRAMQAIQSYQESKRLSDSWLSHFDLARAYIEAGAFTNANTELETCLKRGGEATDIYHDEQQTFRFFPPTYYYLGRALEGMKSAGAADAYRKFLAFKVADAHDPMVADARKRLAGN